MSHVEQLNRALNNAQAAGDVDAVRQLVGYMDTASVESIEQVKEPSPPPKDNVDSGLVEELHQALRNAIDSGNTDAASKLADALQFEINDVESSYEIPGAQDLSGMGVAQNIADENPLQKKIDRDVGLGEAALSMGSSLSTGLASAALEASTGYAKRLFETKLPTSFEDLKKSLGKESFIEFVSSIGDDLLQGMSKGTYEPRTEKGAEYLQSAEESILPAIMASPFGPLASSLRGAPLQSQAKPKPKPKPKPSKIGAAAKKAKESGEEAYKTWRRSLLVEKAKNRRAEKLVEARGASNQAQADKIIKEKFVFTEGRRKRDASLIDLEETVMASKHGTSFREESLKRGAALRRTGESFKKETGAKAKTSEEAGRSVVATVGDMKSSRRAKVSEAYDKAYEHPRMQTEVKVDAFAAFVNKNYTAESTAPIITVARKEGIRLGALREVTPNVYESMPITRESAEQIRRKIIKSTGIERQNIAYSSEAKRALDKDTWHPDQKTLVKARKLHAAFEDDFTRFDVMRDMLSNKAGTNVRKVHLESVVEDLVLSSSVSNASVKRLALQLKRGGKEGVQAWKEIQGESIRKVVDSMLSTTSTDAAGMPSLSYSNLKGSINKLSGKLETLFTKSGSEKLKGFLNVVKNETTIPKGKIAPNTSTIIDKILKTPFFSAIRHGFVGAFIVRGLREGLMSLQRRYIQRKAKLMGAEAVKKKKEKLKKKKTEGNPPKTVDKE